MISRRDFLKSLIALGAFSVLGGIASHNLSSKRVVRPPGAVETP
ncbi:MAG: twin-arginine translocation signal domain-containing protein [Thermoprotei archaeon]|nr:twin-arginine translocation signal domain-containing protein [Thermoprotei archaeon]